jgi:hypothetical protein
MSWTRRPYEPKDSGVLVCVHQTEAATTKTDSLSGVRFSFR